MQSKQAANHPLEHRFQAALVGALWGYAQADTQSLPFAQWASLVDSSPQTAEQLWRRSSGEPLTFLLALLPLLLAYSDDEAQLRGWGALLTGPAAAAALEGASVLRQTVDAIIGDRPLGSLSEQHPFLSPYLQTASAYYASGSGLVQVKTALEQVARDRNSVAPEFAPKSALSAPDSVVDVAPRVTEDMIALTLALHSASRTPGQVEVACRATAAVVAPEQAGAAAAVAGYLCGLTQGLSGLSLERYQMLDAKHSTAADPAIATTTVTQLSQILLSLWSGAIRLHAGPVAIAMPGILRAARA